MIVLMVIWRFFIMIKLGESLIDNNVWEPGSISIKTSGKKLFNK
jgi:hypothetical protein